MVGDTLDQGTELCSIAFTVFHGPVQVDLGKWTCSVLRLSTSCGNQVTPVHFCDPLQILLSDLLTFFVPKKQCHIDEQQQKIRYTMPGVLELRLL